MAPWTSINWAAYHGHLDVVEYLHDFYADTEILELKAYQLEDSIGLLSAGHMDIMEYYLEVMPNAFINGHISPSRGLFIASYLGNVAAVDFVLELGADVHWRTSDAGSAYRYTRKDACISRRSASARFMQPSRLAMRIYSANSCCIGCSNLALMAVMDTA